MARAAIAHTRFAEGKLTIDNGTEATLTATEIGAPGSGANAWTMFGGKTECPGTTYTGHKLATTPHELLKPNETKATITPHYAQANCGPISGAGEFTATVDMTGCDYVLNIGVTTPKNNQVGTYGLTTDIVCPPGKHIDLTVWNGSHTTSSPICHLTVTPQTGLAGPHVTNAAGQNDFNIVGQFHKIVVHREGFCLFDGQGSTTTEGTFDIDATVQGHDAEGAPVGVTVTD